MEDFALILVDLHDVPVIQFLRVLEGLRLAALPSGESATLLNLVSFLKLVRVQITDDQMHPSFWSIEQKKQRTSRCFCTVIYSVESQRPSAAFQV